MGLIKSIRKVGQKVGTVMRKAAPIVGLIPGVGTVAGAALGAAGSIAEGHRGWKGTLGSAAMGGLSGFGNTKLLGGKGILGVPGAISKAAQAMRGTPAAPGVPGSPGIGDRIASAAQGLLPRNAQGGLDLAKILGLGAGGYAAYTGNKAANALRAKQDIYTGKQLGIADEIAGQGRGLNVDANTLRGAAMPIIQKRLAAGPRATPNFSQFNDPLNPFAKRFRPAIGPAIGAPAR